MAASGGAACVSGWELQLPTDGRPLPVPQSNAYSHSFERESKTQNLSQRLTARGTRILDGTTNECRGLDNAPNCELITTTKA